MIRNEKKLEGCVLHARDGEIGRVKDLYFDDLHWRLRYFVVETGSWLNSRRVLISPEAVIAGPMSGERILSVDLTKEQVRNSPETDTDKPVERQRETELRQYYGWPPYSDMMYGGSVIGGPWAGGAVPFAPGIDPRLSERSADVENATQAMHGDPNLRSADEVEGYRIEASDGEIGHVEDFLIEDSDWTIRYLVVDTRNWWPGKKVILSPAWIRNVSWASSQVVVDLDRATIKGGPAYDPSRPLSSADFGRLHDYYGRPRYPDWDLSADNPVTRKKNHTM